MSDERKTGYAGITPGSIVGEKKLEEKNRSVFGNTLIGRPLGTVNEAGENEYEIVPAFGGTSYINGKPQGTVFGADMVIATENPALATKWDMGIPLKAIDVDITGSAYIQCTTDEETLEIGSGTDANAEIKIKSVQRVRYEPGAPLYMKFTAAFPKLADANGDYTVAVGFYDYDNGLLLAQRRIDDVLYYGFIVVRDGNEQWFDLNDTFPQGFNPNNLNIYRIDAGYLGIAPTNVYVRNTISQTFKKIHRQTYDQRITSVKTPDLPIGAIVRNQGNTLDIKILNGSIQAGTINGKQEEDPSARTKTYRTIPVTIPTSPVDSLIVAFKNPVTVDMYDRLDSTGIPRIRNYISTIASALKDVQGVLDGQNKTGSVDLYLIPETDVITGIFTSIELGYSILQVSDDATFSLANAEFLETFPFGSVGDIDLTRILTLDLLFPGQVALFVVTSASVSFEITWKIKYQDRF